MSLFVWVDDDSLREFRIELSRTATVLVIMAIFTAGVLTGVFFF